MKTTWYFDNRVLPKRPEITLAICSTVLANPIHQEMQPNGRIRFWGEVVFAGETTPRIVRVVLLDDGETVHTEFIDSGFRGRGSV